MSNECRQVDAWLDAAQAGPMDPALGAHAAACPACARRVALEHLMRTGLGAGAALDAARKQALVDRIAPVRGAEPATQANVRGVQSARVPLAACSQCALPQALADKPPVAPALGSTSGTPDWCKSAMERGRRRRWPWAAGAAAVAAAVILSLTIFRPEHRQPVSPTELFGSLLGPLADFTPPPTQAAAPADTHPSPASPLGPVLAAFWGDFEGPLSVGLDALRAPAAVAGRQPVSAASPPGQAPSAKNER